MSFLLLAGVPFAFAQTETKMTPAERSIAQAQEAVKQNPKQPDGYNALSLALSRRARETSNPNYYEQAEEAVRKSLEVAPANLGALKARAWLLLGKHEFAQARQVALELNKRMPDDVLVYGFLTDANVELGSYEEAEKACNWMLKLRPGNIPGLTRAAFLRELFGDLDGAVEAMTKAYQAMPVAESEDRAWALTQIAHLKTMTGRTKDAGQILEQALALFPGYHYALANLAKVRKAERKYDEAVSLLRRRYEAAPHAENLYDLAEALKLAGRKEEAAKAFKEFEAKALAEAVGADNANRELIYYYAGHAFEPAKALEIAEREYARRRDVYTLAAYAWALHVNGKTAEARRPLELALAVGVRDSQVLDHARQIGLKTPAAGEAQP
jgi:tetratricopeptide (TPR) repeat protein